MGNYLGGERLRVTVMVSNEYAALRLAHPTVVPDDPVDHESESEDEVDTTGTHPTVRASPMRSD